MPLYNGYALAGPLNGKRIIWPEQIVSIKASPENTDPDRTIRPDRLWRYAWDEKLTAWRLITPHGLMLEENLERERVHSYSHRNLNDGANGDRHDPTDAKDGDDPSHHANPAEAPRHTTPEAD